MKWLTSNKRITNFVTRMKYRSVEFSLKELLFYVRHNKCHPINSLFFSSEMQSQLLPCRSPKHKYHMIKCISSFTKFCATKVKWRHFLHDVEKSRCKSTSKTYWGNKYLLNLFFFYSRQFHLYRGDNSLKASEPHEFT